MERRVLVERVLDEYRRIDNVPAKEITLTWNLRHAANADPFLAKQVCLFKLENLGTMINGRWQALRIVKRGVRILCQ